MTTPPSPPNAAEPPARARIEVSPRLVFGILGVSGLAIAYAPELAYLAQTWWNEPDYSHGFLVPLVALAIARRRLLVPLDTAPSWLGLVLLAAVLIVRGYALEVGEFWLETATIIPALAALTLAIGGWPLLRRLWPAIAFLVFMLTVPAALNDRLSQPLQRLASTCSSKVLRLSGLWVLDEGNVLELGDDRLEVATACNGLAMLMSLSASVSAIVLLVPTSRSKRIILILSALPIAILCNVLRITATACFYEIFGSEAGRKFAHDMAGFLMMPLALALIGIEMTWVSWLFRRDSAGPAAPPIPTGLMTAAR